MSLYSFFFEFPSVVVEEGPVAVDADAVAVEVDFVDVDACARVGVYLVCVWCC